MARNWRRSRQEKVEVRSPEEIEPGKLYSLSQARLYIPSARQGRPPHRATLMRWIDEGLLKCQFRYTRKLRFAMLWGYQILDFLQATKLPDLRAYLSA